jgi:hypothetical protein
MRFDPNDPFPFSEAPYGEQQEHARFVDAWLGLRTDDVESAVSARFGGGVTAPEAAGPERLGRDRETRYWIGLPTTALLTPYSEIRLMLSRLPHARRIVDLGAGYGRMGFVIARHHSLVDFLGIEVVPERVREGAAALTRFGARGQLIEGDLTKMPLPEADTYFLYDYGSRSAIEKTIDDLRERSLRGPLTVVGRGGATRSLIEKKHLWLSGVVRPEHFRNFSIYRTASGVETP